MINTILVGFADEAMQTKPILVSGIDAKPIDQINIFDDAKTRHKFPDGVKLLVRYELTSLDCAVFISSEIADGVAKADKTRAKADAKARETAKAATKAANVVPESWEKVRKAASARNDLMGRLNSERAKLRNHEQTPENLRNGKTFQSSVDAIRKLITGDPEKKIAGLETQVADAVKAYDEALAAHEALTKPKESAPAAQLQEKRKPYSPTVAEYVAGGYDPHSYPPSGCESVSSPEEIAAAVEKFNAEKSKPKA